ncbi:MAG: glycoside hydrolase family 2, partial [Oscillospiraceae bacterium]|nr:glycoside hydrolase family 2 [Oscillospiraceae bacterium]
RFLYHADKMGFIVWGEMPAAYVYSRKYVKRIMNEFIDEIFRDYNHPCIVVWTPINESWGVQNAISNEAEQHHISAMVHTIKSLDSTRLVVSNDGWEHTGATDLLTIHDYSGSKSVLKERYKFVDSALCAMPAGRSMFVSGKYDNQPILITEFGGISYKKDDQDGWGYTNAVSDEDFIRRYCDVVSALLESPLIQGFCYTQLTDVEQEINGLLTYQRKPKVDVNIIKAINEGNYIEEKKE